MNRACWASNLARPRTGHQEISPVGCVSYSFLRLLHGSLKSLCGLFVLSVNSPIDKLEVTVTICFMLNQLGNPAQQPPVVSSPKTVAAVVRAFRDAQGLSLRAFAEQINVSHQTVAQWERGAAEPETDRLAAWFNDDREWLRDLSTEIFVARYRATLL